MSTLFDSVVWMYAGHGYMTQWHEISWTQSTLRKWQYMFIWLVNMGPVPKVKTNWFMKVRLTFIRDCTTIEFYLCTSCSINIEIFFFALPIPCSLVYIKTIIVISLVSNVQIEFRWTKAFTSFEHLFCFFHCNEEESSLAAVVAHVTLYIQPVHEKELMKQWLYPSDVPLKWVWSLSMSYCVLLCLFESTTMHSWEKKVPTWNNFVATGILHSTQCSVVICNQIPKIKYL